MLYEKYTIWYEASGNPEGRFQEALISQESLADEDMTPDDFFTPGFTRWEHDGTVKIEGVDGNVGLPGEFYTE